MSLQDYLTPSGTGFQFPRVEVQQQVCTSNVVVMRGLTTVSQAAIPVAANLPAIGAQAVGCVAVCGANAVAPFQPFQLVRVVA